MKKLENTLQARTMRRVVAVYYLKKVFNWTTLRIGLLGLSGLTFGSLVHVAAVFRNMPAITDVEALYSFGTYAFFHTGFAVQGVIVALSILTALIARDMVKVILPNTYMKPFHA